MTKVDNLDIDGRVAGNDMVTVQPAADDHRCFITTAAGSKYRYPRLIRVWQIARNCHIRRVSIGPNIGVSGVRWVPVHWAESGRGQ